MGDAENEFFLFVWWYYLVTTSLERWLHRTIFIVIYGFKKKKKKNHIIFLFTMQIRFNVENTIYTPQGSNASLMAIRKISVYALFALHFVRSRNAVDARILCIRAVIILFRVFAGAYFSQCRVYILNTLHRYLWTHLRRILRIYIYIHYSSSRDNGDMSF